MSGVYAVRTLGEEDNEGECVPEELEEEEEAPIF